MDPIEPNGMSSVRLKLKKPSAIYICTNVISVSAICVLQIRDQFPHSDNRVQSVKFTRAKILASYEEQTRIYNEGIVKRAELRRIKMAYYSEYAAFTARLVHNHIYYPKL